MPSNADSTIMDPSKSDASETNKTQHQPSQGNGASSRPEDEPKLSGAELKKQKQSEKAARRAQAISQKQGGPSTPSQAKTSHQTRHTEIKTQKPQSTTQANGQHRRTGSMVGETRHMPVRVAATHASTVVEASKSEDKAVDFFRHLNKIRTTSIADANKEVHPAVLALGLQMSNYTICGSCARMVATLQVFKKVIDSYTTPPGNTLTRHLTSHVLSPQIEYLSSCRPLSISMGNAIRWLKLEISRVDIDVPDAEAKKNLCEAIDVFIRERVTFADQVIAQSAAEKIRDGDVIMTYAKSSIVQRALVDAYKSGKNFRVIVIDSRPLHEGKHLAAALVTLGIDVKYCLLNGLAHNIHNATKIFLGAHAMMSNGWLFSRVGTALVAMEANEADKPVIVLCETVKFTERVALDSIVHNEIAPAEELVLPGGALEQWKDIKRLQLCNPMFDVTPANYIQMIVTESGSVPPTSVPVLHRLGNENQQ